MAEQPQKIGFQKHTEKAKKKYGKDEVLTYNEFNKLA